MMKMKRLTKIPCDADLAVAIVFHISLFIENTIRKINEKIKKNN
jgi:hypothetical protein